MTTVIGVMEEQFELLERCFDLGIGREVLRYILAGVLVVGIDLATYYWALPFLSINMAKALSFVSGGVTGYFLHRHWTFANTRWSVTEPFRFALLNAMTLGINIGTNHHMLTVWPGAIFLSWAVATAVTGLTSYSFCKLWVFRM